MPLLARRAPSGQAIGETIRQPLPQGIFSIAVWSKKGDATKTTTAAALAFTLAKERPEQVLLVDAEPDGGSLARRLPAFNPYNNGGLTGLRHRLRAAVQPATAQAPAQLDTNLLLSPQEFMSYVQETRWRVSALVPTTPCKGDPYNSADDTLLWAQLGYRMPYRFVVVDTGTQLESPVSGSVFARANHLVVVTTDRPDTVNEVYEGLTRLASASQQVAQMVRAATLVVVDKERPPKLSAQERQERNRNIEALSQEVKSVVHVPYDAYLAKGRAIDETKVAAATHAAYRQLTAHVITDLAERWRD